MSRSLYGNTNNDSILEHNTFMLRNILAIMRYFFKSQGLI